MNSGSRPATTIDITTVERRWQRLRECDLAMLDVGLDRCVQQVFNVDADEYATGTEISPASRITTSAADGTATSLPIHGNNSTKNDFGSLVGSILEDRYHDISGHHAWSELKTSRRALRSRRPRRGVVAV